MAKLADASDLGSDAARHGGSIPFIRTKAILMKYGCFLKNQGDARNIFDMATISRQTIATLNEKLVVTLQKDDYIQAFEKSLKTYAKTASIPGFRKGMVPVGIVKKMYGASVFTQEVLNMVEKELNNYMVQENLEIFAQPMPLESDARMLDMNNPGDYMFAFEIGLKPAININYQGLSLNRYVVQATTEMIDEEMNRLRKRHGKLEDTDAISDDETVLNFVIKEVANEEAAEAPKEYTNSLLVRYFKESYRSTLSGKKSGDSFKISLNEAFEDKEKEWLLKDLELDANNPADADKVFEFSITKAALLIPAEPDETFFEAAYPGRGLSNEEELRNAIKIDIESQYASVSTNQLNDQVYHHLIDHTNIELPESFLKRWIREGGEKQLSEEDAANEMPKFISQLKWNLISTQLINEFQITVLPEEIKAQAQKQVMAYMGIHTAQDAPWLDQYAERMMKDKKFIENTYYQLQAEKMFEAIVAQANIVEESITPEALEEKMHNHHH